MGTFIKSTVLCCVFGLAATICNAQLCNYKLSGKVSERGQTIPGAIVRLLPDSLVAVTDTDGKFSIPGVCGGMHTIAIEAAGYTGVSFAVAVDSDKVISVALVSNDKELGEVVVNGQRLADLHTVSQAELSGLQLLQTRGQSLGEALKDLPGVSAFQTGPTLFKPVIHGLYSNRILIINDGVTQEGQQWGSEHAPEIDPFAANKITVIKGAASVRYGSDAIGGVILLTPSELPTAPGINGDLYLIGESNGKMGVASGTLEGAFGKKLKGLSWRVQGTARDAGTFRTPTYYLTNTATKEGDFSADIGYKWKGLKLDVHYSEYNAKVGIFAGAEANSQAAIDSAFKASKPFAPSYFTYDIDRSYQTISHDLLKASAQYTFDNKGNIEVDFAVQKDLRKEYSADLQYNINPSYVYLPQLVFQLNTQTLDIVYTQPGKHGFSGSCGFTGIASGNLVQGIFYLVPNFRSYNGGVFAIERYTINKLTFEAGIRYDYRSLQVYKGNQTSLAVSEQDFTYANNITGTAGVAYHLSDSWSLSGNVGTAWRAPSINELYIDGVHFSNAQYEIGDSTLHPERSINTGLSVKYTGRRLRGTVDVYDNVINDYIYEKPTLGFTPVYGVFYPTFQFTQSNVDIKGADVVWAYDLLKHLTFQSKTTIVRGYNRSANEYLIDMPSDRFQNEVIFHLDKLGRLTKPYVSVENTSVLRQTEVPPNADYEPPPAGYALYSAHGGFSLKVKKQQLFNLDVSVNNITNVQYRDYLDQYRYFANELGVNCTVRIKYSF